MTRVSIVGNSGAGKTTFGRRLAAALDALLAAVTSP